MIKKLRLKKVALIFVIGFILAAVLGLWALSDYIQKQNAYHLLENAVASQPFANMLDVPKRGTSECYPHGKLKDYCLVLTYKVDEADCRTILQYAPKDAFGDCIKSLGFMQQYQNKEISYIFMNGDNILQVMAEPR